MAKVEFSQNSFVGGALDPTLFGRTDISNYHVGAAELKNVVVLPQGGVKRRPGLAYIDEVPSTKARLIPFIFNDEEQYLFVLSAGQLDIFRKDIRVATLNSGPIANITEDMLVAINWTQSNDVLFLVHADLPPIEIARMSHMDWSAVEVGLKNIPPFAFGALTVTKPQVTCTPSSLAGSATLTTQNAFWTGSHVGQFVNIHDGRVYIEEVLSPTEAKGTVRIELTTTIAAVADTWELEEGYEPVVSSMRGWPRAVSFYQGRLVFGGLKSRPQTLLFSKVGSFFDLDLGDGAASDAIDVTIDDDRANVIRNVFPGRGLQIFTTGGEFLAAGGGAGEPITPENITLRRGTFHGCSYTRPESVDGATLFVEGNGRVIRSFLFSDVEQAFATDDVTLMSAHLLRDIKHMALRRSTAIDGANFLYVINGDGTVAVLNTLRSQNLRAWSQFQTVGKFLDVAVLGEKTFFLVARERNGQMVTTLERLDQTLFVDSGLLKSVPEPTQAWLGLDHLTNQNVQCLLDGFSQGVQTVQADGALTLENSGQDIQIGLGFEVCVHTLPLVPAFKASAVSQRRRLVAVSLLLEDTGPLWVEAGKTRFSPPLRSFGAALLDTLPKTYSGWLKTPLGGLSRMPMLKVFQTEPAPFHLLSLTIELGV